MDINSRSLDGWTALHFASSEGHLDVVKVTQNFNLRSYLRPKRIHPYSQQ